MSRQQPSSRTDRGGGKGHNFLGAADGQSPKAPKRKGTPTKSVACPTCGAEPGAECVNQGLRNVADKGKPMGGNHHPSRNRMATRANNQAREAAGTLKATNLDAARTPGTLEDPDAPECPSCGLHIRLNPSGRRKAHTSEGGGTQPRMAIPCPGSGGR